MEEERRAHGWRWEWSWLCHTQKGGACLHEDPRLAVGVNLVVLQSGLGLGADDDAMVDGLGDIILLQNAEAARMDPDAWHVLARRLGVAVAILLRTDGIPLLQDRVSFHQGVAPLDDLHAGLLVVPDRVLHQQTLAALEEVYPRLRGRRTTSS